MSRTLAIGDIHGGLKALKEILKMADVQSDDLLIFLGDYVDGWSESAETIDFLIDLKQRQNCIILKGNHDDLILNWLKTDKTNPKWLQHGGRSTIKSYSNINKTHKKIHADFIENLPHYHIDEQNRLFVHAGFANLHGPDYEFYDNTVYWDRTLWEMAMATNPYLSKEDKRYPTRLKLFSEIYIGHTPTNRYGEHKPMQAENVFNLDTGAAYRGPLTMMNVDSKEIWQSTPVHKLYPNEIGRN